MSATPIVSVLLPVRNGGADLIDAVESVRAQTVTDFRLLILDDGSTDGRPDEVRAINDSRVIVHRFPARGITKTLNAGLQLTASPFLARADADDLLAPERLERQLALLEDRADLVIVGSAIHVIDVSGRSIGVQRFPLDDAAIRRGLPRSNPFAHPSVTMRTAALRPVGGYDDRFPRCEDYATWPRLLAVGQGANIPDPLVIKRLRAGGVSVSGDRQQLLTAARMRLTLVREGLLPPVALGYAAAAIVWASLPDAIRWEIRRRRFADDEAAQLT